MDKISISLSQLRRREEKRIKLRPKDAYLEQEIELRFDNDGSYTHYYECPCGKGYVVDDKDATIGFRSRDIYIVCEACEAKYKITK